MEEEEEVGMRREKGEEEMARERQLEEEGHVLISVTASVMIYQVYESHTFCDIVCLFVCEDLESFTHFLLQENSKQWEAAGGFAGMLEVGFY